VPAASRCVGGSVMSTLWHPAVPSGLLDAVRSVGRPCWPLHGGEAARALGDAAISKLPVQEQARHVPALRPYRVGGRKPGPVGPAVISIVRSRPVLVPATTLLRSRGSTRTFTNGSISAHPDWLGYAALNTRGAERLRQRWGAGVGALSTPPTMCIQGLCN